MQAHCKTDVSLHRLLYYMVMKFRNCSQSISPASVPLSYTIYKLCSFIWHERNLIDEMQIPNALKDLYLEQSKPLRKSFCTTPVIDAMMQLKQSFCVFSSSSFCGFQHCFAVWMDSLLLSMSMWSVKLSNGSQWIPVAMNIMMDHWIHHHQPFLANPNEVHKHWMEIVRIIWLV